MDGGGVAFRGRQQRSSRRTQSIQETGPHHVLPVLAAQLGATLPISAAPDGVSHPDLVGCVEDAAHCPAYYRLLVKALLEPGLVDLAQSAVPVHLVVCEKDRVVPPSRFRRHFATNLPAGTQVSVLDGVGHIPMFEAPGRVRATLADLTAACGPHRQVAVARELTKVFEDVWRGTLGETARHAERTEPRGEHVVVVGPAPKRAPPGEAEIEAAVRAALADGRSARDAASDVANALGVPRRRAYDAATRLKPPRQRGG